MERPGLIAFEDARAEMQADNRPLELRMPWVGTVCGLLAAAALLAGLAA